MHNLADAQNFMERLRDSGCSLALDNFGTGLHRPCRFQDMLTDIN